MTATDVSIRNALHIDTPLMVLFYRILSLFIATGGQNIFAFVSYIIGGAYDCDSSCGCGGKKY